MEAKSIRWISVFLLILGAAAAAIGWYVVNPGNELGWALLSTVVIWPVVVAFTGALETLAFGSMRRVYVILVLVLGLAVSLVVRFTGGALISGLIALAIIYALKKPLIAVKNGKKKAQ